MSADRVIDHNPSGIAGSEDPLTFRNVPTRHLLRAVQPLALFGRLACRDQLEELETLLLVG